MVMLIHEFAVFAMKNQSIVYINFAQYDNTGRILDYLKQTFPLVIHFSFDHLRLKNGRKTNFLRVYKGKKLLKEVRLSTIRTPGVLLFPSLPLVALYMFLQTLVHVAYWKRKYNTEFVFFTVNAYSAWIGFLLKKFRLVEKTIFWVWDYFPVEYPDWRMRFARFVYLQFDKLCMNVSDTVIFTNDKLRKLCKKEGYIKKPIKSYPIVPIGTEVGKFRTLKMKPKKIILGFLGMIKTHQGIDLVFDSFEELIMTFPNIQFHVIGSGPEEERIRKRARYYKKHITFSGFIEDQNEIKKIIKKWTIGIATYIPLKSNESYWGDPSKIKTYISEGIPIITTDVSYFADELAQEKAGIVIPYGDTKAFIQAIKTISKNRPFYKRNALRLAKKYDYKVLYPKLFTT
jgi:glycosyltransferase involved in cell wall biosynthesis